jgi:hypothetical protein
VPAATKQLGGIGITLIGGAWRLAGAPEAIVTPTAIPIAANTKASPSLRRDMLASTTTDSAVHHGAGRRQARARIATTGALPAG